MMKLFVLIAVATVTMVVATDKNDCNYGDVMKMLKDMQEKDAELEAKDALLREEVLKLKAENKAMRGESQMTVDSMFLATFSEITNTVVDGGDIVWDTAPINPGGHFSTETGGYTASINGYYQFSAAKMGNNYFGAFYFVVDGERYAFMDSWVPDTYDKQTGSATTNVLLTAGQVVKLQSQGSTLVYGTDSDGFMNSWFTGHLLYAL